MGEVVDLETAPAVEYEGEALCTVAAFSKVATELAEAVSILSNISGEVGQTHRRQIQGIQRSLSRVIRIMDALGGTMDVMENCAGEILEVLNEGGYAQFVNEYGSAKINVYGVLQRRCSTFRVQILSYQDLKKNSRAKVANGNFSLTIDHEQVVGQN